MKEWFTKLRISLFPHQKKAAYLIIAFLILFFLFTCAPRAGAAELRVNMGARVLRGDAAVIHLNYALNEFAPGLRPVVGMGLLGASNDEDWGPEENNGFFYAGVEARRGRFALTLGGAGLMRETQYSGTRGQFMLGTAFRVKEWSWGAVDAAWYHFSNSGIKKPNPGFDLLSVQLVRRW